MVLVTRKGKAKICMVFLRKRRNCCSLFGLRQICHIFCCCAGTKGNSHDWVVYSKTALERGEEAVLTNMHMFGHLAPSSLFFAFTKKGQQFNVSLYCDSFFSRERPVTSAVTLDKAVLAAVSRGGGDSIHSGNGNILDARSPALMFAFHAAS